ncbi:MAG: DNA polymerase III subunit gamma/tau [Pseudomonadales bacterium]|nr:DNA polymerase III subunit gamma/tau [Pseudomonadales bacterium]
MAYEVLARKWRPGNFATMVGQEHVLRALSHALDGGRLHHAYLFTGTRGVGKTTVARILARCLNCEQGVSATPCGECGACREISEGRFVDLIEVDAASRTKVEDTRELLDNVQYAPTRGRFKVYLIDEVHMLSTSSFNALLKTLEEPPPHVKFLLATTDPKKLPVTVLSRCLQFHLKNMTAERIVGHLEHVLGAEGVSFEPSALWALARAADGSMRDALSLTDQAIAHGGGALHAEEVAAMLGTIDQGALHRILEALAAGDGPALMACAEDLAAHAADFSTVLGDLLRLLHDLAVAQVVPEALEGAEGDEARAKVQALAARISPEDVQLYYQIALTGVRDLPYAPEARVAFEMTLLRMLAFQPEDSPGEGSGSPSGGATRAPAAPKPAAAGTAALRGVLDAQAAPQSAAAQPAPAPEPEPSPALGEASVGPFPDLLLPANWGEALRTLDLVGVTLELAQHCVPLGDEGDRIRFALAPEAEPLYAAIHETRLAEALSARRGRPVRVQLEVASAEAETPAQRAARGRAEAQAAAEAAIESDAQVQALRAQFGAQIIPGSLRPLEDSGSAAGQTLH